MKQLQIILLIVLMFGVSGCSTLQATAKTVVQTYSNNSLTAAVLTQVAIGKLIELSTSGADEQTEFAKDIVRVVEDIKKHVDLTTIVIVSELEIYVKDIIREGNLEPSNQILAFLLVDTVATQLNASIEGDILDAEATVFLHSLLNNVIRASRSYIRE